MSQSKTEPTQYSLTAKFNGHVYRKRTSNLDETIKALKPDWLHTEVFFTVKKGKNESVRRLSLIDAKRVFSIDTSRQVFINNLLFSI